MSRANALIVGVLLAIPMSAASAQDKKPAAEAGLEEVVVTAERRKENLQVVPVMVTAVSSDQLKASGVNDVMQLSNIVPSLSVIDPTGFTMAFIRGVGSSTLGGGTFASVATYIDGVYVSRTTSGMFEFDGADSVQVLAGPQGSLYGRNATAGAIVVSTYRPKPGDPFTGSISATFGSYNNRSFGGKLAGGITDKLAFAFSGAKHDRNGFVKNLNPAGSRHTEDMDDRNSVNASLTLVYKPTDTTSFALRGGYAKSNDRAGGGYEAVGQNVPGPIPGFNDNRSAIFGGVAQVFGPVFGAATPTIAAEAATTAVLSTTFGATYDNQFDAFSGGALKGTHKPGSSLFIENKIVSLNSDFEFDTVNLRSVTAYTESLYHGSVQVALEKPNSATSTTVGMGVPAPLNANGSLGFSSVSPGHIFSQGFQLLSRDSSKIKWIAGADYSSEKGKVDQTGDFFGFNLYSANDDWGVDSAAGFGQATIPFGSNWSATLGGRYTNEKYKIHDRFTPNLNGSLPGVNVGNISFNSTKFTYTARVERQADNWLAYGGVSTGFKSATLNAASPAQGRAVPEEVTSFEVGMKRDFADRYRFNAAAYFAKYKSIQINRIDQATGANTLDNGPDSEVKGLDLQAIARIFDNFQVSLGATFLDAKFVKELLNANGTLRTALPFKGNLLPGSSKVAASLVADWKHPLSDGSEIGLTTTVVHNSGKFYDQYNLVGSGGTTNSGYNLVNLNLTYKAANDRWTASVWGNNVFDEKYYRTGIVAFGFFGRDAIAGNPAHFGVTVNAKFQ